MDSGGVGKPAAADHSVVAAVISSPLPQLSGLGNAIPTEHSPRQANRNITVSSNGTVPTGNRANQHSAHTVPVAHLSTEFLGNCEIIFYRTDLLEGMLYTLRGHSLP